MEEPIDPAAQEERYAYQEDARSDSVREEELYRRQQDIQNDQTKVDLRLLEGQKTGTPYDPYLNLRIRAANLTGDKKLTQTEMANHFKFLFLLHNLGEPAKKTCDFFHAFIMIKSDISVADEGMMIKTLKHSQLNINRNITSTPQRQAPQQNGFNRLLPKF